MKSNTDKTKLIIKQKVPSRPKMSSTHVEMCVCFRKVCCNGAAVRLFFCEEKSLIRNFCLLLDSQEWHEGNSWFVTLSLALRAMRAPPHLHSLGLRVSGCYFKGLGLVRKKLVICTAVTITKHLLVAHNCPVFLRVWINKWRVVQGTQEIKMRDLVVWRNAWMRNLILNASLNTPGAGKCDGLRIPYIL